MWRARRENMPPLTTICVNINLSVLSITSERVLLHQDGEMMILATDPSLQLLAESDAIFTYGTFMATPKHFEQLCTIHGTLRGHFITSVYALLLAKNQGVYFDMFVRIRCQMMELPV